MINTMKSLLALCLFYSAASVSTAETPIKHTSFRPGEIWTDNNGAHINAHGGGILYDKGTYYWYGEHKVEGDAGNYAQVGVHCYSSKDLYNWKDEGIALKVVEGDHSHPIAKGCILERPKVVYNKKTGKYVMWFHLELKGKGYGSAYAGVATATKPTGPFKFLKAGRVNPGKWPLNMDKKDQTAEFTKEMPDYVRIIRRDYPGGQMSRDMTIFVDDNGKAYHIYSGRQYHPSHRGADAGLHGAYGKICPGVHQPLHGSSCYLQTQGQILSYRFRMHGLGSQRRPQRRGQKHRRPMDGIEKSLRGAQGRHHVRRPEHFHPACTGQTRKIHLHGGHLAAQKRH